MINVLIVDDDAMVAELNRLYVARVPGFRCSGSASTLSQAQEMINDKQREIDLVLLDELTYMVAYDYLPLESVLSALRERPAHQSVIITGRGCHRDIIELADTVSELRPVKHAFDACLLYTSPSPRDCS